MADAAGTLRAYRSIIRRRVRSQAEYRSSFAFELFGSAFVGVVEFAEMYAIFDRTKAIAGFGYDNILLLFGFATFAFSLADLCIGHIESLSTYVRVDTFETCLLHPSPPSVSSRRATSRCAASDEPRTRRARLRPACAQPATGG